MPRRTWRWFGPKTQHQYRGQSASLPIITVNNKLRWFESSFRGRVWGQRCFIGFTMWTITVYGPHRQPLPAVSWNMSCVIESYLDDLGAAQEKQMFICLRVSCIFNFKSSSCVSSFWAPREAHLMDATVTWACLTPSPSSRINTAGGKGLVGSQRFLSVSHCLSPSVALFFFFWFSLLLSLFLLPDMHTQSQRRDKLEVWRRAEQTDDDD